MKEYYVDVGVRFDSTDEWTQINEVLYKFDYESAGTGFGVRDMQFPCPNESEAEALADKIRKALEDAGFATRIEYVSASEYDYEGDDQ